MRGLSVVGECRCDYVPNYPVTPNPGRQQQVFFERDHKGLNGLLQMPVKLQLEMLEVAGSSPASACESAVAQSDRARNDFTTPGCSRAFIWIGFDGFARMLAGLHGTPGVRLLSRKANALAHGVALSCRPWSRSFDSL